jgi:hypothetical protein
MDESYWPFYVVTSHGIQMNVCVKEIDLQLLVNK